MVARVSKSVPSDPQSRSSIFSGAIYLLPLILHMVGRTYDFGLGARGLLVEGSDPIIKTAILAFSYVLATVLVFMKPGVIARASAPVYLYGAYAAYAALTAFWSDFPEVVGLRVGHMIGLIFIGLCTSIWARDNRSIIAKPLLIGMVLALVLSILFVYLIPSRGIVHSDWAEGEIFSERWVGITNHPNLLGAICVVAVWAALTMLIVDRRALTKALSFTAFALSAICLKGSDSRTAVVGVAVLLATMMLVPPSATLTERARRGYFWTRLIVITLGACIALFLKSGGLQTRSGAQDALSARPLIWRAGIDAILNRPWGWSFDLSRTYWMHNIARQSFYHFHNGYLDIAVRGGIFELALFIIILTRMYVCFRGLRAYDYGAYRALIMLYACNIVYNFAETSFDRESIMWSVMAVSWICAEWRYSFCKSAASGTIPTRSGHRLARSGVF